MGKKEKNQKKLLRLLRSHENLNVREAMRALSLSEALIRRCFIELEKLGQALRYHGGIRMAAARNGSEYHFYDAISSFLKRRANFKTFWLILLKSCFFSASNQF